MKDKQPNRKSAKARRTAAKAVETAPPHDILQPPTPAKTAGDKAKAKGKAPVVPAQAPPLPLRGRKSRSDAVVAEAVHSVLASPKTRQPVEPKPPNPVPTGLPTATVEIANRAEPPHPAVSSAPPVQGGEPAVPPRPPAAPSEPAANAPIAPPSSVDAASYASRQSDGPKAIPGAETRVSPKPDFETLARNLTLLMEQGSRAAAAYFAPKQERPRPPAEDYSGLFRTFSQVAEFWVSDPARLLQAQAALSSPFLQLWADTLRRYSGAPETAMPPTEPGADKRFADPEWRDNPFFDFVRRAYLIGTGWAADLVERAESLDEPTRDRARFYMRQISSALAPSNFVFTNPEVLRETVKENAANLVRGMSALTRDIAAGGGELKIRQTDISKFELGVNIATTPGKVVFRNALLELIQYAPSTEQVLKRPLLIVPPWINKFYILDLNPEKSLVKWAVAQGLTVFIVSWVNPDSRHAAKDWDAYAKEGILTALDAVMAVTGESDVAAAGYCVGGTLLAATLALMAGRNDRRISSATFLTTQVDFTHAGDLKNFADEGQIRAVEAQMREAGTLSGSKMAQAFNMLRPDDLIWSYVVNNYLKGKEPLPFDLLAWNADATRMAAANHSFYLRNCYLENALSAGRMVLDGQRLDLGEVTIPIYNLATREDHIAPALSVFEGSRCFGGPVRFVLAGSGHIAGVVSPPARAKYGFWLGGEPKGLLEDWIASATHHPGSWWTDWIEWLRAQAPATVAARTPGTGDLPALEDAPGSYVRETE